MGPKDINRPLSDRDRQNAQEAFDRLPPEEQERLLRIVNSIIEQSDAQGGQLTEGMLDSALEENSDAQNAVNEYQQGYRSIKRDRNAPEN